MARVHLHSVTKVFGTQSIVKDFTLTIEDGEFIVLLGPSGCGKSTTLRMIAGLDDISAGQIYIGDTLVNHVEAKDRNLAMVFQSYALYPHMSVAENISFSLRIAGMKKAEISSKVAKVAAMLQLTPLLERKPSELSGGQRQRVAMGRAMVREPQLFLFDEPLSNLDTKLRGEMREEIKAIHARLKTTTIYVTHDQIEAMTLADRIVIMRDGHIEQVGTPIDVFLKPANAFVAGFIGSPGMNFFDAEVRAYEGHTFLAQGTLHIPLPEQFQKSVRVGDTVLAGIRPTDLTLGGKYIASFASEVVGAEVHGAEVLVKAKAGNRTLQLQVPLLDKPELGSQVACSFDPKALHLFNQKTGRSLAAHEV